MSGLVDALDDLRLAPSTPADDGTYDARARAEEAEALAAIFSEEMSVLPRDGSAGRLRLTLASGALRAALEARLPYGYPSTRRPMFTIQALDGVSEKTRQALTQAAAAATTEDGVCVFDVATAVSERFEDLASDMTAAAPAPATSDSSFTFHPACPQFGQRSIKFDAASADGRYEVPVVAGEPVTDRRSTFQAFLATDVDSPEKAHWARFLAAAGVGFLAFCWSRLRA
mmetsp:Transcript_21265/g.66782  ORF Transcript_21265/g.66782 Transcript_21265/m.66782 type:complete len:228 (-) Transcript_21265:365-1048(-)